MSSAESKKGITGKKVVMGETIASGSIAHDDLVNSAIFLKNLINRRLASTPSSNLSAYVNEDIRLAGRYANKLLRKEDEIAPLLNNCTLKDDPHLEDSKNEFLQLGFIAPEKSLRYAPQKKLLVLNLSGILVDIVNDLRSSYKVEKKMTGKPIFKRPFCDNFLKFCFENFNVGIWSSRRKHNVETVVDYVLGELKHKLLFFWDQSKCTDSGFTVPENRYKPIYLIELKKLWNKEDDCLPWQKGEFSPSNTLLLDDTPYKALLNPPCTAVFPRVYNYSTDIGDNSLGPGGDIRSYLEKIAVTDDVQCYVKEHPFGQPAITASSPNWNLYSQIIKKHATMSSLK